MKIAYVGNFTQSHCTEVHLAATLENLGHEVIELQEDVVSSTLLSELITGPENQWDLFLFTRTWGNLVTMEHLAQLRERKIPTASYHLDLYVGLKREDGLDNDPFWRTDYVFTPDGDPASQEVFKRKGINHIYMKPGVFEPECHIAGAASFGILEKDDRLLDVLFVGGGEATGVEPQYGHKEWPYRGELIKFLRDTYGERFIKKGWPQETVRNEALNVLYSNTKVVVGDSLCLGFDHPYYWSDRVYETIGRGGFIIHPYIKGMEEEFTDGKTIVFYEFGNWNQLKQKIDYYLEHDEEREQIRRAGHEFVKKNCTYTQRLERMLSIIFDKQKAEMDVELAAVAPTLPAASPAPIKISLGAGAEPETEPGWVNVDIVELPGIQVVHNLMNYPWPFETGSVAYIKAKDIIEHMATHLPDGRSSIIAFIEECYRILKPGGILWIQTPAWDADFLWIDLTHVRGFDERSFDFFDPETDFGRSTGFYSEAKFKVTATRLENDNLQFEMIKL
jgi:hypothetical protein